MGADLASWYDTITSKMDVQNHETLANRQIWYETLLLAYNGKNRDRHLNIRRPGESIDVSEPLHLQRSG
uniref:hypothetical protein n=1 Tax=Escherichia coli TaxID=562 RepID=UPI0021C34D16|nr:hypothetical protein [Escherichia coli]CAH8250102.1 Uncharacterised protein [Escherichia coli]CAH8250131.1 Uncharacterised protein [Enterobacter ludwigii]